MKYEYCVVRGNNGRILYPDELQHLLNKVGKIGWKLNHMNYNGNIMIFERKNLI